MKPGISIRIFSLFVAIVALSGNRAFAETEPNNTRAQANLITFDVAGVATNTGKINPLSDLDFFSFTTPAFAGQATLVITMTPTSPDNALDARLQLQDSNGVVLVDRDAGSDDAPETITFTQATGGTTYYAVGRSADFVDAGSGDYSLQVALNDPNDQISEALSLGAASQTRTTTGQLDPATDVDMFAIAVQAGQRLSFDIDQASAGFDSFIRLFDAGGTQLTANDDATGPVETNGLSSFLEYTFTNSGTFYVGVSGNANSNYNAITGAGDVTGSTGSYTLVVSPGIAGTMRRPGDSTDYLVDIIQFGPNPQPINPNQRTWIVTHGWNSSRNALNISELANSLAQTQPGDQVLTLDWRAADTGLFNPFDAENSIVPVGEWAAAALAGYGFNGTNLNLMGHSFGSYVSDELAQRVPGGVNTIVTLDPAANVAGGYDPVSSVDFGRDSFFSWSFHSSSLGNEYTPATADGSFIVETGESAEEAHSDVVFLFAYMLMFPNDNVGQYFLLAYLLNAVYGPWAPDQYASYFPGDDPVQGYEAIITTAANGTNTQSIAFVTNAPGLTITSHSDGANVTSNPIILSGTATDAGHGDDGISAILVNGAPANNGTATGTNVASWDRTISLNFGTNLLTVVARDNGTPQASTTNVIAVVYVALPAIAIAVTNGSATVSWSVAYPDFVLQQNDNLDLSGWNTVTNVPVVIGESNVVVVPVSEGNQFFRLRR